MTKTLREANFADEPLVGGVPALREPVFVDEPLVGGIPALRESAFIDEPLVGGVPNLSAALFCVEALHPVEPEPFMATDVFPTLIGLTFDIKKTPEFNSAIRNATSGRETATAFMQYPWWNFELTYDYLPDAGQWSLTQDVRTIAGFFLKQQGRFGRWLFRDPDDFHIVGGSIATGDAVTLQWPFFASIFGGPLEPVGQVDQTVLATFLPAAVNTGADTITLPAHGMSTGQSPPLFFSTTGGLPAPLTALTPYWPIVVDANTIKVATSAPKAIAGTAVNITTQGTGVDTIAKGFAIYETVAETDSVPAMGPYTITVTHASVFIDDLGVTLAGAPLVEVPSSPATGQYSVDETTGVYTFNAAQASASVVITYTYQADPTGLSLSLPNQLVFTVAPASGLIITADFDYWFVCRFLDDKSEFNKMMDKLWELQKLDFRSVIQ